MRNKFIASTMIGAALAVAAAPAIGEAATKKRVLVCDSSRHSRNTGTVVGALAGGLLGNAVAAKGVKTEGTVLGAGVGAVAGHQIAKHNSKNCHYVYRTVRR